MDMIKCICKCEMSNFTLLLSSSLIYYWVALPFAKSYLLFGSPTLQIIQGLIMHLLNLVNQNF